jgi:hypothetical protein
MTDESTTRVFRVTVRGQFHQLSDQARRYLEGVRAEHDIFKSSYTAEGTFTYDERVDFFNLRYELRAADSDSAGVTGLIEAETFLDTMQFAHRNLKVDVVDLSAIWDDVERRRR